MKSPRKNKRKKLTEKALPVIPNKIYFTISEVSQLCALKPYVLRFWEGEFPQLRPSKQSGNRRVYQLKDILLIREIRKLLYEEGFTIDGARQQLSNKSESLHPPINQNAVIKKIIADLESVLQDLRS